jgi:hypothetical protein
MALANLGSLVLQLMIFFTTLINLTNALARWDSIALLCLYVLLRVVSPSPGEEDIYPKWRAIVQ